MTERVIYEAIPVLPPWAATIIIVCLAISLAGLGIWLAAPALERLVRLYRRTLASRARVQHWQMQSDRLALNYWIRDSFRQNARANSAEKRAAQERSLRQQLAKGVPQA